MLVDTLAADLRDDEGWRPYAYDDANGQPVAGHGWVTIGFGFLVDARKGVGLPKPVAEFWLKYAINERLDDMRRRWPAFDSQPDDVQRAIGNMAYQMGPAGVIAFTKMLAALERGDRAQAADEALESTWAKQTPKRAKKVAAMIRGS